MRDEGGEGGEGTHGPPVLGRGGRREADPVAALLEEGLARRSHASLRGEVIDREGRRVVER